MNSNNLMNKFMKWMDRSVGFLLIMSDYILSILIYEKVLAVVDK